MSESFISPSHSPLPAESSQPTHSLSISGGQGLAFFYRNYLSTTYRIAQDTGRKAAIHRVYIRALRQAAMPCIEAHGAMPTPDKALTPARLPAPNQQPTSAHEPESESTSRPYVLLKAAWNTPRSDWKLYSTSSAQARRTWLEQWEERFRYTEAHSREYTDYQEGCEGYNDYDDEEEQDRWPMQDYSPYRTSHNDYPNNNDNVHSRNETIQHPGSESTAAIITSRGWNGSLDPIPRSRQPRRYRRYTASLYGNGIDGMGVQENDDDISWASSLYESDYDGGSELEEDDEADNKRKRSREKRIKEMWAQVKNSAGRVAARRMVSVSSHRRASWSAMLPLRESKEEDDEGRGTLPLLRRIGPAAALMQCLPLERLIRGEDHGYGKHDASVGPGEGYPENQNNQGDGGYHKAGPELTLPKNDHPAPSSSSSNSSPPPPPPHTTPQLPLHHPKPLKPIQVPPSLLESLSPEIRRLLKSPTSTNPSSITELRSTPRALTFTPPLGTPSQSVEEIRRRCEARLEFVAQEAAAAMWRQILRERQGQVLGLRRRRRIQAEDSDGG